MHQKERKFLKELNELESILKVYVNEFFIEGKNHSAGDKIRFYKFLAEYHEKKAEYHGVKQKHSECRYKKAEEILDSFFGMPVFSPNHK